MIVIHKDPVLVWGDLPKDSSSIPLTCSDSRPYEKDAVMTSPTKVSCWLRQILQKDGSWIEGTLVSVPQERKEKGVRVLFLNVLLPSQKDDSRILCSLIKIPCIFLRYLVHV